MFFFINTDHLLMAIKRDIRKSFSYDCMPLFRYNIYMKKTVTLHLTKKKFSLAPPCVLCEEKVLYVMLSHSRQNFTNTSLFKREWS